MKNWTSFALAGVILAAGTTLALAGQPGSHAISHQDSTAAHDDEAVGNQSTDGSVESDKKELGTSGESSNETTGKKGSSVPAVDGTTDHGKDGSITNAVKPSQKKTPNNETASPH